MTKLSLDELANKHNTDKGTLYKGASKHGYAPFYDTFLEKWRTEPIRMLEVGVWMEITDGGESIEMWREYFEKAKIYTFDIRDMTNHKSIVNNKDVYFFRGDQGNRQDFVEMYSKFGSTPFDFILEDGSHMTNHQIISLAHLFKYVKSGGYYILEDITTPGLPACCIRNDETYNILTNFIQTGNFVTNYITEEEKKYLEENIEKIVMYTDVQNAYKTALIYKK
jgi:cephalosporin hydroxylase